jgi:predicted nucleotidyltransferase
VNLINFLKKNENTRKIFGERELKIIEKQLLGINLTQSEKNRLSRDIRKKFEFIKEISHYSFDLRLKKAGLLKEMIDDAKNEILNHPFRKRIQEIWLFGSTVDRTLTFRSDVDLAVVFDKIQPKEAFSFRATVMGGLPKKMDIQVFNTLPEKIKKTIKESHKVLYRKNG